MLISATVGRGGVNQPDDVRLVQRMLNDSRARQGQDRLKVDGIAGPKTNAAIEEYQRRHALPTDGKIDIHGPTLNHLLKAFTNSIASGLVDLGSLPGLQQGPATELTSNDLQAAVERFNLKPAVDRV